MMVMMTAAIILTSRTAIAPQLILIAKMATAYPKAGNVTTLMTVLMVPMKLVAVSSLLFDK